jgi:phage replication O-like protein O
VVLEVQTKKKLKISGFVGEPSNHIRGVSGEGEEVVGANPQLEDGYTRIANELLEAFARTRLAGQECQVVFAVARLTYGFGKKEDRISYGQIARMTFIARTKIIPLVRALVLKLVLSSTNNGTRTPPTLRINKHYSEWLPSPKKGTSPNNRTIPSPNNGVLDSPNNGTHQRKKEKKDIPTNFLAFSKSFLEFQQKDYPNVIKKITERDVEAGAKVIDELVRLDGHDFEIEIRPAINWAARDLEFWKKNLLSLASLRRKKEEGGLSKFQKIMASFAKNKKSDDEYAGTPYEHVRRM